MSKVKYYAVKIGKVPGIYMSWDECRENVSGFSGAEYKSFGTIEEARAYLGMQTDGQNCKMILVVNADEGDHDWQVVKLPCDIVMDGDFNLNNLMHLD